MFFAKEKNILVSLEKLSTFVNAFTVCKFCNKPIKVEEDNDKSVGLDCFLKIVCQNEKCLKSKINSSVNMSNEIGQFFEINYLCFFASIAGEKSELGIIVIIIIIIIIIIIKIIIVIIIIIS